MRSTSRSRARMTTRAGRCSRDSSRTSSTRVDSLRSPRTCTSRGRSETSKLASGEAKAQCPTRIRTSGGPVEMPTLTSPLGNMTCGELRRPLGGSRLEIVKSNADGIEHEVSVLDDDWRSSVDHKANLAIEDRAVKRPPGLLAPHAPPTGAADELRERGARLEQRDHFCQRIDHSGLLQTRCGLPVVARPVAAPYRVAMRTILITGCSSGFGLETARYFLERLACGARAVVPDPPARRRGRNRAGQVDLTAFEH